MFLGLRSHILDTEDITASKAWWTEALGHPPYFDEPFYVGFDVGGYELGLLPARERYPAGGIAYWGVDDIEATRSLLLEQGATAADEIHDVGEGILMCEVVDPAGNRIGLIHNPHFGG